MNSAVESKQPPWSLLVVFLPWAIVCPLILVSLRERIVAPNVSTFAAVIARTSLLASLVALASVGGGLVFAFACRRVAGRLARLFPILLLPTLIGGLFWGFAAKLAISDFVVLSSLLGSRSFGVTLVFVLGIHLIQVATLSAYVLWLCGNSIEPTTKSYAAATRLTPLEFACDVFWPQCRSLVQALLFLIVLISATEYSATELAIHPSSGTATAGLSHWLYEEYAIWQPVSYRFASAVAVLYGILGAAAVLGLACGLTALALRLGDAVAQGTYRSQTRAEASPPVVRTPNGRALAWFAVVISVVPIVGVYVLEPPQPTPRALELGGALAWSLPAATVSFAVSVTIAVFLRLSIPPRLRSRVWVYGLILHPMALAPLVFSAAAFVWLEMLSTTYNTAIRASWILGHVLHSMPLLVCFAFWTYSGVSDRELQYQRAIGASIAEVLRTTFWHRFYDSHTLLLLFAWSMVWNDGAMSRAAAPAVSSLYAVVAPLLSARPQYGAAQFCLAISVIFAVFILLSWQRVTSTPHQPAREGP